MVGLKGIATSLDIYDLAPISPGRFPSSNKQAKPPSGAAEPDKRGKNRVNNDQLGKKNPQGLSDKELRQLEKLKRRDQVVRAHEHAHIAAGGPYVRGGPKYVYQRGPDGKLYAIGGEVPIDVSPVPNDPQATIRKMQVIKRAALAPAQPSPQDYRIAAQAAMEMQKAQAELNKMKAQAAYGDGTTMNSFSVFSGFNSALSIVV